MKTVLLPDEWELVRVSTGDRYPLRVPGDTVSCLIENGVIPDPYYGLNEIDVQWVGREQWIFRSSFQVEKGFTDGTRIFLTAPFVDTFAEFRCNGASLGFTDNAFRTYRFDVTDILTTGENILEVLFESPEKTALQRRDALPYPVPHTIYPSQALGRNLIRKVQCHAGWDWGPCLMVSGIYDKIKLEAVSFERIDAVHNNYTNKGDSWDLEVCVDLYAAVSCSTQLSVSCCGVTESTDFSLQPGLQSNAVHLTVHEPELWWPVGYGRPVLHELVVRTDHTEIRKMIGFRTIEVINRDDTYGRSMYFRVNGRDIFCKGANWIPMDALPDRYTAERYEELLDAAVEANMNMLRVWGGGQYEQDLFYELCDQKGILVWQDFMFACALYPADPDFLENVRIEVIQQVKRLKDHPSIAIWCGNNEDVGALTWFEESRNNRDRYIIDYDRLNEGTIGKTVKSLDPGRKWWPSSPSAGEDDFSDCWHDDSKGDMHYWSVWHEGKPFEAYHEVTPRFCSEFGFQSFPSLDLIRTFTPKDEMNLTSPVMEHHQKNDRGNAIIIESIARYFRFPSGFGETVYLSQVQQAMAMQTAVEYWRSQRPVCMGALYWQLNDNWPVVSWSSIEYGGKWKALHYAARRFFAPRHLAIIHLSGENIRLYGLNDYAAPVSGVLTVRIVGFNGTILEERELSCSFEAESSTLLDEIELSSLDHDPADCFLYASFSSDSGDFVSENSLLFLPPKKCNIIPANISLEKRISGGSLSLKLSTDVPAFFTILEAPEATLKFSDNNFTLFPWSEKTVEVSFPSHIDPAIDPAAAAEKIEIHSLRRY